MRVIARCTLLLLTIALLVSHPRAAHAELNPWDIDEVLPSDAPSEAPVLLSPSDGDRTTGATDPPVGVPTLAWSSVEGATKYHVQISTSAGFADPIVEQDTYATSFTPVGTLADGTYYWRVKAGTGTLVEWGPYSGARSFTKDWCDEGSIVPGLLSPSEGATRASFQTSFQTGDFTDFTWTPVTGAATYLFQISTDESFGSPSSVVYEATTIVPQHTPDERPANNVYYWRVTPIDHRGNYGAPSPVGSFIFAWSQPPELISPEDGVDVSFVPRFSWTAVEAAREYRLQISTEEDFPSVQADVVTRNTDYTPVEALSNDQDYFWRVQAIDYEGHATPWSEVRGFRTQWNFQPQLLTPANNSIKLSYPFFSWSPSPGVERYQIQIDIAESLDHPMIDKDVYNVTTYAHPQWQTLQLDRDYYWRVRGVDVQDNYTPWGEVRSFRTWWEHGPNPVYPLYYYEPISDTAPVHSDRTIAWPLFVWDTAHVSGTTTGLAPLPDYYELTVDDDPAFGSPNFQIETRGLAAAPTSAHPFDEPEDGKTYYWRVRAYRDGSQLGYDAVWKTRYDSSVAQLEIQDEITPTLIYPPDGFEAVGTPPVLGWLPVTDTHSYTLEIRRGHTYTESELVERVEPQFVNYVPWQGRRESMPFGTYWWHVQTPAAPPDDWSEWRHFNLSLDVIAGNPYDCVPPDKPQTILASTSTYSPTFSYVYSSSGEVTDSYQLGDLHVMVDRTIDENNNYNWVIAFEVSATVTETVVYGMYFDTDHVEGSGAGYDPEVGKPITAAPLYRPEYALYISRTVGSGMGPAAAWFYSRNGSDWDPAQSLESIGGDVWYDADTQAVQVLLPYTAIGSADPHSVGSVALVVFSTTDNASDGIRDSIPPQGDAIDKPAFVSDMLMPLYPFDTPLFNPTVYYDMPPIRWRMPYFDSIDGYRVEVARDAEFTDLVETWETYETGTTSYFALMPTTFQSLNAYEDNESYYWHVCIRHERYKSISSYYDYGPWSPAMRFKLASRVVTDPRPSGGDPEERTPTFIWDRVEGAAGYSLQVDDDANFSSPLIDVDTDATSYTPREESTTKALVDGMYYWRVAILRKTGYNKIMGQWTTPALTFTKTSLSPIPVSPISPTVISQQPTFVWTKILTPTNQPRLAAPRYRLQVDSDQNFGSPKTYTTDATSYTLPKGYSDSLADGWWYWRVAIYDANNKVGPYSSARRFYKEYLPPTLLAPAQGSSTPEIPTFEWRPLHGAAYYKVRIADNEFFNGGTVATTDNTRYTPTTNLGEDSYYWSVQMYDADNKPGAVISSTVTIGPSYDYSVLLPVCLR